MSAALDARGVGLAAISVDTTDDSAQLARELVIDFPLLSDPGLRVALSYGVAMAGQEIAVPAVFIVLPNHQIFWARVGETIADRPSNEELLSKVDQAIAATR